MDADVPAAYAPIVVHDRQERFELTSVEAAPTAVPGVRPGRGRPTVYARVRGDTIQFHLFYSDNPHDRGILRTGRHLGDWELVEVRPGRDVTVSQHSGGERCGWDAVERVGTHPVVYVANGSHATYLRAGTRDRTFPDPNDEADGRGTRVRPRVVGVTATTPEWMAWPGRWGPTRARPIPGESDSPLGPSHQPRWRSFANLSRCHAAASPTNHRETAMLVAAALLAIGASSWFVRSRRRA